MLPRPSSGLCPVLCGAAGIPERLLTAGSKEPACHQAPPRSRGQTPEPDPVPRGPGGAAGTGSACASSTGRPGCQRDVCARPERAGQPSGAGRGWAAPQGHATPRAPAAPHDFPREEAACSAPPVLLSSAPPPTTTAPSANASTEADGGDGDPGLMSPAPSRPCPVGRSGATLVGTDQAPPSRA